MGDDVLLQQNRKSVVASSDIDSVQSGVDTYGVGMDNIQSTQSMKAPDTLLPQVTTPMSQAPAPDVLALIDNNMGAVSGMDHVLDSDTTYERGRHIPSPSSFYGVDMHIQGTDVLADNIEPGNKSGSEMSMDAAPPVEGQKTSVDEMIKSRIQIESFIPQPGMDVLTRNIGFYQGQQDKEVDNLKTIEKQEIVETNTSQSHNDELKAGIGFSQTRESVKPLDDFRMESQEILSKWSRRGTEVQNSNLDFYSQQDTLTPINNRSIERQEILKSWSDRMPAADIASQPIPVKPTMEIQTQDPLLNYQTPSQQMSLANASTPQKDNVFVQGTISSFQAPSFRVPDIPLVDEHGLSGDFTVTPGDIYIDRFTDIADHDDHVRFSDIAALSADDLAMADAMYSPPGLVKHGDAMKRHSIIASVSDPISHNY